MGKLIEVLVVIGMPNFRGICLRNSLNSKEINALKMILRGYEIMDKTVFDQSSREEDSKKREAAKKSVFAKAVEGLNIFSCKKICSPLAEILSLELKIFNEKKEVKDFNKDREGIKR